jgi:hypothetical protein
MLQHLILMVTITIDVHLLIQDHNREEKALFSCRRDAGNLKGDWKEFPS